MSLLDLHLNEVEEPSLVEPGEYEMRITAAQVVPSKSSSRDVIRVICKIEDQPQAQPVFLNFALPIPADPENSSYFMKLNLKRFFTAFAIDPGDPGNPSDWIGLSGWGVVSHKENADTGDLLHDVSKWVQPAAAWDETEEDE